MGDWDPKRDEFVSKKIKFDLFRWNDFEKPQKLWLKSEFVLKSQISNLAVFMVPHSLMTSQHHHQLSEEHQKLKQHTSGAPLPTPIYKSRILQQKPGQKFCTVFVLPKKNCLYLFDPSDVSQKCDFIFISSRVA